MNIRELILKDMPNNLNDLEKARYVYLKLGDIVDFSTKYNNTSLDEMGLMLLKIIKLIVDFGFKYILVF